MTKKLPKPLFTIILLATFLIIAGTSAYLMLSKTKKESFKTPEGTQITWFWEEMGIDERTEGPLMRVRVEFKGKMNKGYDVGTYIGNCFEIAKSRWEFLENEISSVICMWGGVGDEIGVFKEEGKLIIKHGELAEGSPATTDSPAIPHFRGDFKPLLELKLEGWLPYEFAKTNDGFKKPFLLFYPPEVKVEKASEFTVSEYSYTSPDRLAFNVNNQKCWMVILPPAIGIEEPPPDFSSEEAEISIGGTKWETLVWKVKDKVTLYNFINKNDPNYSFSVNPENLSRCLETYKQILATFKFTN